MTINTLIEDSGLSRYYVTKAVRGAGIEIRRGRKPTELTSEQAKKVKAFLRKIVSVKNL